MYKSHIIEQRENDGMCFPVEKVYVLMKYSTDGDSPCAVFTDQDKALKAKKRVNKKYSCGIIWDDGQKYLCGEPDINTNYFCIFDIQEFSPNTINYLVC